MKHTFFVVKIQKHFVKLDQERFLICLSCSKKKRYYKSMSFSPHFGISSIYVCSFYNCFLYQINIKPAKPVIGTAKGKMKGGWDET